MKLNITKKEAEKFIADRHGPNYQVSIEMGDDSSINYAPVLTAAGGQLSYASIATIEILKAVGSNFEGNSIMFMKLLRTINTGLGLREARDAVYNTSMAINYIHLHNSLNGFIGVV
jgi:hypothetical protein